MSIVLNIPKLRFPEYTDDWEKKNIISISEKLNVGFVGTCEKHYINKDNGIMLIRTGNLVNGSIQYNNLKYVTPEFHFKNKKSQVKMGDILIARHGSNGQACIYDSYDEANTLNIVILRVDKLTNPEFLINQINSPFIKKQILSKTAGSTQGVINTKEIGKLKVLTTTLLEQNKIAVFLKAVDNKIEQLSKKQELLEKYKKGLMQKIFSQETRFKADDGSNYPDWEEKKLGEYLTHKSKKNRDVEVDLVLSVSNKKGFITQDEQFDGYQVASKDLSNYKIVKKGEYAYNPSRINVGSIARLINYEIGIVSPMYVIFKLNNLDSTFFDNLYQTHLFKHLIKVGCSGSVRDSLNFNDMSDFFVTIPSFPEQQKIAIFLSSVDNRIEQIVKQLDETKQFKKALLQQMFV